MGYTASSNFPVQSPFQGSNAANSVDAFVTKLNPAGSALVYSTYLGGSATDYATAIAVDSSGSAYVTGIVTSEDFPLANPMYNKLASHAVDDVFVTKFNPSGSSLVYSTYLGGGSADEAYAMPSTNRATPTLPRTNSSDFPRPTQADALRLRHVHHGDLLQARRNCFRPSRRNRRCRPRHRGVPAPKHTHRRRRNVHGFSGRECTAREQRRRILASGCPHSVAGHGVAGNRSRDHHSQR